MTTNYSQADKKVLATVQELSDILISHKYDSAWEKAGELNFLLKNREGLTLSSEVLDKIVAYKKAYYKQNELVNEAHKAMSAIGHKLSDIV